MPENNNLTIWQRLSQSFGPNSMLDQSVPTVKFDKQVLLKTQSQQEYDHERLEAQQTLFLSKQWAKIENNLYTQSVYYEPTRLASYYDYESMEYTPEIASALDTFAEESTTPDKNGVMLQVYSESQRVRSLLEELFYDRLDINTNLPMWTRNTCKYGDNFVFLKLDQNKGVVGCYQLPNIDIERVERGMVKRPGGTPDQNPEAKQMKFSWKNKQLEFNTWEVAHFRLLGDDRKLPYGTSILEKARRIWKQLVLAEDAMLIYRTSRAPERRVFKVFVGNMDDKDVEAYVQRFANKFKRDQISDPKTGNVDLRYNQMAVDQDYFVPVRDPNAPNPIDTLAGAQNLSEIADIEYIQKKLLTALRMPKAFLGFEEVVGDGKNLALQDIRFARTINRVQNSMLAELNKIAIIHLFLLGFEDELSNFTLGLTNPSTQADLLKVDIWKEKMILYRDMTTPIEGIAPASHTFAKKHVLDMTDNEIKLDLQQQRIEKAISLELQNTGNVITKTGLFNTIDAIYGSPSGATQNAVAQEPGADMGMPPMGGGGGMPTFDAPGDEVAPLPDVSDINVPEAAPPPEGETLPEDKQMDKISLLIENGPLMMDEEYDLTKSRANLSEVTKTLNKLLRDNN